MRRKTMSSCQCPRHENIIPEHRDYTRLSYQEHKQNIVFMIVGQNLFIINSTNYVKTCQHCGKQRLIYIYGTWPNVRASFDGATDLPIRIMVYGIEYFELIVKIYNEPNMGKFIYAWVASDDNSDRVILFCQNIEKAESLHQNISVDGEPVICCRTMDLECVLINTRGEIIETEAFYSTDSDPDSFNIGHGILKYTYMGDSWTYNSNPEIQPIYKE